VGEAGGESTEKTAPGCFRETWPENNSRKGGQCWSSGKSETELSAELTGPRRKANQLPAKVRRSQTGQAS